MYVFMCNSIRCSDFQVQCSSTGHIPLSDIYLKGTIWHIQMHHSRLGDKLSYRELLLFSVPLMLSSRVFGFNVRSWPLPPSILAYCAYLQTSHCLLWTYSRLFSSYVQ